MPRFAPSTQGRPRGPARASKAATELKGADKMLLQALAKGGEYSELFAQARAKLPPESTVADLFVYPPAQRVRCPVALQRTGSILDAFSRAGSRDSDPRTRILDPQVRSTLTEAWVSRETLFEKDDFQMSLDKAMGRMWARFSQRIKLALADAEAKQDAGLQDQLKKEYLDVQRRIKEFISFYDEA